MNYAPDSVAIVDGGTRAASAPHVPSEAESRHIAGLLAYVEREAHVSQRQLAGELGVALGLVNTYIKRCVKKGLIKVQEVPSRRYAYFLTPTGFTEKSRLAAEFLSWSLSFFRRARAECSDQMLNAKARGWGTLALVGGSDLAEIAILCANEHGIRIVGIVDAGISRADVHGVPVFAALGTVSPRPDGWLVTGIEGAQAHHDAAIAHAGPAFLLVPPMLSVQRAASRQDGQP